MKIKPMSGEFALEGLEYVESSERLALVEHRVPRLPGTYFQQLGSVPALARLRESLQCDGVECLTGHAVTAAEGRRGLRSVRVAALSGSGPVRRMSCDAILVSGGWTPSVAVR